MPTSATVAADPASASFAVLDVETTGLSRFDRVVQIAIAQVDADGELLDAWSTLIDPGRDPGPTEIHGVTRERLLGAPSFAEVAEQVAARLRGRVLVAHNAVFDARMVAAEFDQAGLPSPIEARLCTIALSRHLDLAVPDFKLSTITDHFGVTNARAHDALSDVLATVEVLRHLLRASRRVALPLPLAHHSPAVAARALGSRPVPFVYPGRWRPGTPLVAGMTVVITGGTQLSRRDLVQRAFDLAIGTRRYLGPGVSLVVANQATRRACSAREQGLAVLTEAEFLTALATVAAGEPKEPEPRSAREPVAEVVLPGVSGILAGRQVLVLGNDQAAARARAELAGRGAIVRADLTEAVTDLVVSPSGQTDPRWAAAQRLGVPLLDLDRPGPARPVLDPPRWPAVLPDGWRLLLPRGARHLQLSARWPADRPVRVSARLLGGGVWADDLVDADHPAGDDGTVSINTETAGEALVSLNLGAISASVERVVVTAKAQSVTPVESRLGGQGRDLGRMITTVPAGGAGVLCTFVRSGADWVLLAASPPAFGPGGGAVAQ